MLDIGLGIGAEFCGYRIQPAAYCEREAYAASQLLKRIEEECLDAAPVWSDLTTFPSAEFRGVVDIICAGFPCQPHSAAGKRKGLADERWLWDDIARIIRDVEPGLVFLENVPGLISTGGLAACLGSLAEMGFDADWGCLSAAAVGASHKRERIFILAVHKGRGLGKLRQSSGGCGFADGGGGELADTGLQHIDPQQRSDGAEHPTAGDGVANASDRLVPQPRRGSQGRDGAGSAVAVFGDATSIRQPRHSEECAAGHDEGRSQEFMSGDNNVGDPEREQQYRSWASRHWRDRPENANCIMADTSGQRLQGREQRGTCNTNRGGQEAHGSVSELCGIFAPGPSDPRWADIIAAEPWRAPATQSGICGVVDGHPLVVDESRPDQLRCVGNGVVPLCVAAQFVELARRATGT